MELNYLLQKVVEHENSKSRFGTEKCQKKGFVLLTGLYEIVQKNKKHKI